MAEKSEESFLFPAAIQQHENSSGSASTAAQPESTSTSHLDLTNSGIPSFSSFTEPATELIHDETSRNYVSDKEKTHKTYRTRSSDETTSYSSDDRSQSKRSKGKRRRQRYSYSSSDQSESSDDDYSRSKRSKKRHRHNPYQYKSRQKRGHSRERSKKKSQYDGRRKERDESSRTYVTDKRGDPDVTKYGQYKYDIPDYRRFGGGHVLGLPDDLIIDREASKGMGGIVIRRKKRYTSRRFVPQDEKNVKRIHFDFSKNKSEPVNWNQTYIPLEMHSAHEEEEDDDDDIPDYRDIERKHEKGDHKEKSQKPDVKQELTHEEHIREKTKNFNTRLEEDPHDISLWLQFIEFQNESMQFGKKAISATIRTSVNEIKISIFEKALELNPNNEKLLLGYLKCCEQTWEAPRLLTKWDQVLKTNPRVISLWMQYLNFRQTNLASFSFGQCVEVFEECLEILRKEAENSQNQIERVEVEEIMVHVFLRLCYFLAQSGYTERAYACWQALIELSFFAPKELKGKSFDDRLQLLGLFWETEKPRFGEKDSKGWAYYAAQEEGGDEDGGVDETASNNYPQENPDEDGYYNWLVTETELGKKESLPLRANAQEDQVQIDDPFRIILFDDISKFMLDLTSSQSRLDLIYACFNFLGLQFNPCWSSSHSFYSDTFLHSELVSQALADATFWPPRKLAFPVKLIDEIHGLIMESEKLSIEQDAFKFPLKVFPQDSNNLFKPENWFYTCEESGLIDMNLEFAKNAFSQLYAVFQDTGLNLCRLALESLHGTKSARKIAKEMLKTERMNLSLWNGYAQLERSRNNISEARKVYITALKMYRSFPEKYQVDAPLLHRMFAEMEIEQARPNTALNILVIFAEKGTFDSISNQDMPLPSPTRLLKARKYYAQKIAQSSSRTTIQDNPRSVVHLCECFALLEYLSQNLAEACKVFDRTLEELERQNLKESAEYESILVAYAKLIFLHSKIGTTFCPALLRTVLECALEIFPYNSIFLSLYFHNEARAKIQNRMRRFLDASLAKKPNHVLWTFSIFVELYQHKPYNHHHVRSLFERALECPTSRSSISLWSLYINFEIDQNNMDRAKALYFRAVRECPWSKDIYLNAFRRLRPKFTSDELDEVINLMNEKEIRLRVPLEKFVSEEEKAYYLTDADAKPF